jgi:hypothetical protein
MPSFAWRLCTLPVVNLANGSRRRAECKPRLKEDHMVPPQQHQDSSSSTQNGEPHQMRTLSNEQISPDATDTSSRLQLDHLALTQQHHEMQRVARIYFERALAGQNKALPTLNADTGEACYLTSLCVSYAALFALGEN